MKVRSWPACLLDAQLAYLHPEWGFAGRRAQGHVDEAVPHVPRLGKRAPESLRLLGVVDLDHGRAHSERARRFLDGLHERGRVAVPRLLQPQEVEVPGVREAWLQDGGAARLGPKLGGDGVLERGGEADRTREVLHLPRVPSACATR